MPYKRKDGNPSKPWVGQVVLDGKAIRKVFPTKKAAQSWEIDQRKPVLLLTSTVSLGELAIRYLDFSKSKFVRSTYQEKVSVFRRLLKVLHRDLPLDCLSSGVVLSFLQNEKEIRSGYAANKDRKNLMAAWTWGNRYIEGFPPVPNPFAVHRFSEERKARYMPSEADFWLAYHACLNDDDKALLLTFLHTGARRGELFRLTWSDVNFNAGTIRLTTRKNRVGTWEEARLPMTEDLCRVLTDLRPAAPQPSDFVFTRDGVPFLYRIHFMKRLCRRAGVQHFGFHAIRHLTASILAQQGVPMVHIQAILRHKNLSTTERYIRGLESVRSSLAFLPGLNRKPPEKPPTQKKDLTENG